MKTSRTTGSLILLAALLPTGAFLHEATLAVAQDRELTETEMALEGIPTNPTVLINISSTDMPASPDILALGRKATKALSRCLADNIDAANRARCAVTLHALGDRDALPTLQAAVDDWEPGVRFEVVRALGAMPDAGSVEPLLKLLKRQDEEDYVRGAVVAALAHISDARVVRALRDEVRDGDLRAEAFEALWSNRHMMSRATLIGDTRTALKSDNNALVLSATLAAVELRSPRLVPALVPLMEHSWPEVRNKAVYALGKIGDKTAMKALLAHLPNVRESRMLNNIAFALERLDQKAFHDSMKSVVEHKQAVIRLNAAYVLGDVRHAEGLPLLKKALDDPSDYVRTSAVVAVGKLGNANADQTDAAIKALEPLTTHENLTVREEAVYAIHNLSKGGRANLVHDMLFQLPADKYPDTVQRAAMVLAQAGDTRVKSYVFDCVVNGACPVDEVQSFVIKHADHRLEERLLLGWARGTMAFTPLVAALKPQGTLPIARSTFDASAYGENLRESVRVIGKLGDASSLGVVKARADEKDIWVRLYSLVGAARLGDAAAPTALLEELDNLPIEWMPRVVEAFSQIEEKAVVAKLVPELETREKGKDVDVAMAAAAIHLAWDPDTAIFRMLDGLAAASSYERDLAEGYVMHNDHNKVTWLLRRALAREGREDVKDRLRAMLDER